MIEITSSKLISYAAFKLVQPLRLIVDLNALPAQGLTSPGVINDRLVKDIHFEKVKDRPLSTRLIATLTQDIEYNARENGKTVKFLLSPKKTVEIAEKQPPSLPAKEEEMAAKEPRLFFSPSKTTLNQILGVDFYMLPKGKSRITVTTTKKADYDLSRKNSLTLLLEVMSATIPSELTRYLNSSLFKGVVNQITPIIKVAEKQVDLQIELKEMVPYHVMQTDTEIRLDFSKTSVKPPIKQITQTRLGKAFVKPTEVPSETLVKPEKMLPLVVKAAVKPAHNTTKYTGARMTLDFANADIRNILKLIGEVSKRNIVWGHEVKGTVSMRLKNVPWDQALDVVLDINKLGMIVDGNIIRVMTKEAIKALEQEEEA
ncbi:MAG: secretin and TonB N-terminal domain-containing protein, partial [Proteobacteria bacterium]|nr:secretin and TonB N-terminal domain-containing protein [Pseudomonadota bacterium]